MSGDTVAHRAARSVTAPARGYFNGHFEMLKEEIRQVAAEAPASEVDLGPVLARLDELADLVAEQGVHQARVLARSADEIAGLREQVGELERVVHQLALVLTPVED